MKKGTKVKKILNNYVIFEDRWISENDKVLFNQKGDTFIVLDFKEVKEKTLIIENVYKEQIFSSVKLDKNVNVGDIFYI